MRDMKNFATFVSAVISFLVLVGCGSSQALSSVSVLRDTVRVTENVWRSDSVIFRDSVVVMQKGDSVTVERWKVMKTVQWRDRWRDSVVVVRDTLRVMEKEAGGASVVERAGERVVIGIGYVGVAFLAFAGLLILYKIKQ